MGEPVETPAREIKRLQRCINDLVSLLALPAVWSGNKPSQIAGSLLDALVRLLPLDFVFVRLKNPGAEGHVRMAASHGPMPGANAICTIVGGLFGDDSQVLSTVVRHTVGDWEVNLLPLQLGFHGEIGVLVAGSRRVDFPEQTEELVLRVAANQAAISLQGARILGDQEKLAKDLDERVSQRTQELAAINEELRKEISEREQAEERLGHRKSELNRSEVQKSAILDSALDCIIVIDHEGRITEFNPAAERTFGHRRNDVIGRQLASVIIPESLREKHHAGFARYLATGQSIVLGKRLEMTAARADGREIPVELTITRIPQDGPPAFTGFIRDISERKRSEDALRIAHAQVVRSEERWRSVFENSAVGVALTDLAGHFIATNPVYEKMLGYTEQELHQLAFTDITHDEDLEPTRMLVDELIAGKRQQFQVENQYRRKDGESVWVRNNVSIVPGSEQVPQFLMSLSEDITERKLAEESLKRSEAFLAEGQRLSRTGSFSWRVQADRISWSEELYRIFEFEPGAPVTIELIRTRVHPADSHLLNDMIQSVEAGVSDIEYEHRLLMPDSSVKYLHLIAHGTLDADGRPEYIGALQDVTQRRLSEEALAKARSELSKVARITSLGVLTASIAHEVNQPLSGIITNASTCLRMLSAVPPNVEGALETARRTIRDGNRAADVITRLRALYSNKELTPEWMDLNDATREVTALLLSELQRTEVMLRLELADDLPPVIGDRIQLQQVILNMIRNAADAMSTVHDRSRLLHIRTEPDEEGRVRLSVRDSGTGFESHNADKLFQAFYTTKPDGMGIGLSISRSIIEAHEGQLWATANDGAGATFWFSIPCRAGSFADADVEDSESDSKTDVA